MKSTNLHQISVSTGLVSTTFIPREEASKSTADELDFGFCASALVVFALRLTFGLLAATVCGTDGSLLSVSKEIDPLLPIFRVAKIVLSTTEPLL